MNPSLDSAVRSYQLGDIAQALDIAERGLAQRPNDDDLAFLAAICHQAQGGYARAADLFDLLARRHPTVPEHWSNLGYMLRQLGRYGDAEVAFQRALSLAPDSHDALLNYGLLLMDMGHVAAARHRFLDAVDVDPTSDAARIYAALACFECGDARRAEALIPSKQTWRSLDPDLRHDLAMALIQVGRVDDAEAVLAADVHAEGDPAAMARLAMLYERTNRVAQARELLARIRDRADVGGREMKVDVLTVESALAMRDKDMARARAANEALLALGLPEQARANAHFALAKIADREHDADEAMAQLAEAHRIQLRMATDIVPEIAASQDEPLRIAERWLSSEEAVFPTFDTDPAAQASPVFIVGYPRSGTTMLEQMLDAHPDFASMDERATLQRCIERMEQWGLRYPADLQRLDRSQADELRAVYWSEVSKVIAIAPGQRLVDKNPLNMLRLPMIKRLFPHAQIILALRHPCDVVLSCYMQNFRSPAFMVLCSTLERLAKSYVNAMRFWIHHAPLLFPDALVLRYEDTVSHFPEQANRIARYLGIVGSEHLERFADHAARKAYISTPSYSQVVEPVNTRAMGRWTAYRAYFESVFPILDPVARHWGYDFETS